MRRLLAALAALAIGSGTAAAEEPSPLAGHTLSCSIAGTPLYGGCYYEAPIARLGPITFSVGVDAQLASPQSGRESYLAPYLLTVLELDAWSAWVEVAAPESWGIPVIGRSPSWRAGFSIQFQ